MDKNSKIFVAGASGMVGNAIVDSLINQGYTNIIGSYHSRYPNSNKIELYQLDLTNQNKVNSFFAKYKPDYVFLSAAKVGGIIANKSYPAEFIYQNLMIESNVISSSHIYGVKKLLFLGSSCIYPKYAPQPIPENCLLSSELEETNEPYALAKIAGIKLCEAYNIQYGTDFRSVMPTNLYGPGDNFHPQNSHVIPAMIRKFHEAKQSGQQQVIVWGTGSPRREFLHVQDLASACLLVLNMQRKNYMEVTSPRCSHINIGSGTDFTIKELAQAIARIVNFRGEIIFDKNKPDGTPQKLLNSNKIHKLGWQAIIDLEQGLKDTYHWYLKNIKDTRN